MGELLKDSPCRERENLVKNQTEIYFTAVQGCVPKGLLKGLKKGYLMAAPCILDSKASIFDSQYVREFEAKQLCKGPMPNKFMQKIEKSVSLPWPFNRAKPLKKTHTI